jgi:hypothetical protein
MAATCRARDRLGGDEPVVARCDPARLDGLPQRPRRPLSLAQRLASCSQVTRIDLPQSARLESSIRAASLREDPVTHRFVVSREQPVLFRHLRAHFAEMPAVSVTLDRRHGDRRRRRVAVAVERRRWDRRAVPPRSWARLGFVVVPSPIQSASTHALA